MMTNCTAFKIENKEIVINDEADELKKELSDSLKIRYQNNLELMRGSNFVFGYVHLLYYKCHKINLNYGRSKNKSIAINPSNRKYNKYFQYAVTVTLNHEEIKKDPQRIKTVNLLKINITGKE